MDSPTGKNYAIVVPGRNGSSPITSYTKYPVEEYTRYPQGGEDLAKNANQVYAVDEGGN